MPNLATASLIDESAAYPQPDQSITPIAKNEIHSMLNEQELPYNHMTASDGQNISFEQYNFDLQATPGNQVENQGLLNARTDIAPQSET